MKKTALIIGLFVWAVVPSMATHIVGGDLHYECLGNNEYLIVLKVYRDCQTGISNFDDPACVGIFNSNGLLIMNVQMPLADAVVTLLDVNTGNPCLEPPEGICVQEAVYDAVVTLTVPAGGLTLAYQRCCRNTTIINCASNDDIGMTLTTTIPDPSLAICNSNPAFVQFPPLVICLNEAFVFDHSATDLDGDSLVYEFCNPLLENSNAGNYICPPEGPPYPLLQFYPQYSYSYPLDANPAFNVDPNTGLLTGTPTQLGKYVVGICVKEYRDGQLLSSTNRDFQFNIAPCSQDFSAAIEPPSPCQGLDVTFGNNSQDATDYFWDFGDDNTEADTSSAMTPSYSYDETGLYTVTLIVNPGSQCADTSVVELPVFFPVEVEISADGPECVNGQWTYVYTLDGQYEASSSFEWDFNGGNPSSSAAENPPVVSYSSQGTYNVEVYVDDGYCTGENVVSIDVPPLPLADIVPQSLFCEGLTVSFENNSSNASTFLWDFGDFVPGDSSTDENPTYTYSDYGTFLVTLVVDPGSPCSYTDEQQFSILPPDPVEALYVIAEPNICDTVPRLSVLWYGQGATSIEWAFGDGNFSNETSAQYVYDDNGTYTVTLTAYNDVCDYEEEFTEEITIGFGPIHSPVLIPNIFTPTGDAKNENFRIFYEDEDLVLPNQRSIFDYMSYYHMQVFDRWGVQVFDSDNDPRKMWDGNFNGESTEGVYYYIVEFQRKCIDDSIQTRDGHLSLLRNTRE